MSLHRARQIAATGLSFRIAEQSGLFPPRDVLNAFLACGRDDLPGEEVLRWDPFALDEGEYEALLNWWRQAHPEARVERLGAPAGDYSAWFTAAVG